MAHYLFNFVQDGAAKGSPARGQAAELMRLRTWGIGADERHRTALAPGDLVLMYLGAPELEFIGRAELASAAREWTPTEAEGYPGVSERVLERAGSTREGTKRRFLRHDGERVDATLFSLLADE